MPAGMREGVGSTVGSESVVGATVAVADDEPDVDVASGSFVVVVPVEAGVSVAAPYRHFKDRDALLAAASVETFGVLRGCWMKPCPPSWSSRQKRSCCS